MSHHHTHTARRVASTVTITVVLGLLVACGGPTPETVGDQLETASTGGTEQVVDAGTQRPELPAGTTFAARLATETVVHAEPAHESSVIHHVPATTEFGSATTLLILETGDDGWIRVALPVRPNGSSGWIRSEEVDIRTTDIRVEITLAGTHLSVYDGDSPLLETDVAVGSPENPTPQGRFFVTDLIENENPHGAYGPFAIGLSAHSDTLSEFGGGDGQIGIHGTNQPSSIGNAVSHGCVRVPNDVVSTLVEVLPLGTPVLVA